MKIYAHRGFSGRYLENTMEAFMAAALVNADGIELDVRLSADGVPVVFHDQKLGRVANWHGRVEDKSVHVLQRIPLFLNERVYHVPTLRTYLLWASETKLPTNIEFKAESDDDIGLERTVLEEIDAFDMRDRIFFSSFNVPSLRRMKKLAPEMATGLLTRKPGEKSVALAREIGCDYYHPKYTNLSADDVKAAHRAGLTVNVWTVDSVDIAKHLRDIGVDGVITNVPDHLRRELK